MPSEATVWHPAEPGPVRAVTVWRVGTRLDGAGRKAALALLCDDERTRADRFLRPEDRDRSICARAALRLILAGALRINPCAVALRAGASGKPGLAPSQARGDLSFNVAHSGDWAVIAVAPGPRIGVDLEALRPISDPLSLAHGHFSLEEIEALAELPARMRLQAFYACWTRKEAFVKALGAGLGFGLSRFTVAIPPSPVALLTVDGSATAARPWHLCDLPLESSYAASLAIEATEANPILCTLSAERFLTPP